VGTQADRSSAAALLMPSAAVPALPLADPETAAEAEAVSDNNSVPTPEVAPKKYSDEWYLSAEKGSAQWNNDVAKKLETFLSYTAELYHQATVLEPGNPQFHHDAGNFLKEHGGMQPKYSSVNWEHNAVRYLREAARLAPDDGGIYFDLAEACLEHCKMCKQPSLQKTKEILHEEAIEHYTLAF
jgi:hypothetical protein